MTRVMVTPASVASKGGTSSLRSWVTTPMFMVGPSSTKPCASTKMACGVGGRGGGGGAL
jgi:hypothetical protein